MTPLIPLDRASVFFDGGCPPVRLRHAECVAIDAADDVWCGGESGEIYRIDRDGTALELVASSNGATLGIAFDEAGYLYVCDALIGAVDRLDPRSGELRRFARVEPGVIRVPNFPVVDTRRGCLYVSDGHSFAEAGPGFGGSTSRTAQASFGTPTLWGAKIRSQRICRPFLLGWLGGLTVA